jgi:hypothetical protein
MSGVTAVGTVASAVAAVVLFTWYARGKNKGHLFLALCMLVTAVALAASALM